MKKMILTLLIICLTVTSGLNIVSAENETNMTLTQDEEELLKIKDEKPVSASENGHLNISFNDGYSGYCINYGKHEANRGDNFTVQDTKHAINNANGQSVGNELKTFFVDYYDIAMQNTVKTQHIIWHFTDGFTGWRVDPVLMDEIRNAASNKVIPDHGATRKINNTSEMVFDFEVLTSGNSFNQNFFAYKITIRDIIEDIVKENSNSTLNSTENENETVENKTDARPQVSEKNSSAIPDMEVAEKENDALPDDSVTATSNKENDIANENDSEKIDLEKHETGYNYIPAFLILFFGTLLIIKYSRD